MWELKLWELPTRYAALSQTRCASVLNSLHPSPVGVQTLGRSLKQRVAYNRNAKIVSSTPNDTRPLLIQTTLRRVPTFYREHRTDNGLEIN